MPANAKRFTLARAMAELKGLRDRLSRAVVRLSAMAVTPYNSQTIPGYATPTAYIADQRATWDEISGLQKNLILLKKAMAQANSQTKVDVKGFGLMTISEILAIRPMVMQDMNAILAKLKDTYLTVSRQQASYQAGIPASAHQMATLAVARTPEMSDDAYAKAIELACKAQMDAMQPTLHDPLKVADLIKKLEDEAATFGTDLDYLLSEVNATTYIDVDYDSGTFTVVGRVAAPEATEATETPIAPPGA